MTQPLASSELTWQEVVGKNWKQQAKTVGVLAGGAWLFWVFCGLITKPGGSTAAVAAPKKEKKNVSSNPLLLADDVDWKDEDEDEDDLEDWDEDDDEE